MNKSEVYQNPVLGIPTYQLYQVSNHTVDDQTGWDSYFIGHLLLDKQFRGVTGKQQLNNLKIQQII
jgi:hypothetical protein